MCFWIFVCFFSCSCNRIPNTLNVMFMFFESNKSFSVVAVVVVVPTRKYACVSLTTIFLLYKVCKDSRFGGIERTAYSKIFVALYLYSWLSRIATIPLDYSEADLLIEAT